MGNVASRIQALRRKPRIYCIDWIQVETDAQRGQEETVARFPLAVHDAVLTAAHVEHLQRVKALNPEQVMLGYVIWNHETSAVGPGNEILQTLSDDAYVPTVTVDGNRLFDFREYEVQGALLEACRATLDAYPFDGLFLDNCTVWDAAAAPNTAARTDMENALLRTLAKLRAMYPEHLLIGNTADNWPHLNGEQNEDRTADWAAEFISYPGHASPEMNLAMVLMDDTGGTSQTAVATHYAAARHYANTWFGACVDYQHPVWWDAYDD